MPLRDADARVRHEAFVASCVGRPQIQEILKLVNHYERDFLEAADVRLKQGVARLLAPDLHLLLLDTLKKHRENLCIQLGDRLITAGVAQ